MQRSYLGARVCASKKDARGLASESCCLSRVAEVAQGLDGALYGTLLAKACLGESQKAGQDNRLGHHIEGCV